MQRRLSSTPSECLLQVPITPPGWVLALSMLVWAGALATLLVVARNRGLAWEGLAAAALPLFAVLAGLQFRRLRRDKGRTLVLTRPTRWPQPGPNCFLGTFSDNSGPNQYLPASLQQHWSHFFGLTLRLNLQNHPHNKTEAVTVTIWRAQLTVHDYRRLNIWANWHAERTEVPLKGETA